MNTIENHYSYTTDFCDGVEVSYPQIERAKFITGRNSNTISERETVCIDSSVLEFLDAVMASIKIRMGSSAGDLKYISPGSNNYIIQSSDFFIQVWTGRDDIIVKDRKEILPKVYPWTKIFRKINIQITAEPDMVQYLVEGVLQTGLEEPVRKKVRWQYMVGGSMKEALCEIDPPQPILPSFYPWMQTNALDYIDEYLASPASVLILRGPPGTGKTSFIRNLVWRSQGNTMITYEEELYRTDKMFVDFITGSSNLLVMEDADKFLISREEGNGVMGKFLNLSEGLIRYPEKKMVISTNLMDLSRIDSALIRPGRCFDTPEFRSLTYREACRVAEDTNTTPPPESMGDQTVTLAQVFNSSY